MSRHSMKWILFTLLLAVFSVAPVLARQGGPVTLAPETEPNNDFDTATWTEVRTSIQGKIGQSGDVDVYQFYSYAAGLTFTVDVSRPSGSPLAPMVSLYDYFGTLLGQSSCSDTPCLTVTLPMEIDSPLFLVVEDANGAGGKSYEYSAWLDIIDTDEPNDFPSQAIPITAGQQVSSVFSTPGDVDVYAISLEAGRQYYLPPFQQEMNLLDSDGEFVTDLFARWGILFEVEESGDYYLQAYVEGNYNVWSSYQFIIQDVNEPLYVSFQKKGTIGGVAFQPADILRYDPLFGTWQMYFQAADVGLKGNVTAIDVEIGWDRIFFTVAAAQTIPGVGKVTPQDVVVFYPTSFGMDTTGWFELYMDGSDVGLTSGAESIDSFTHDGNYWVEISTKGSGNIDTFYGPIIFKKSDMLSLTLWGTGQDSAGTSSLRAAGSTMGFGAANLIAIDRGGDIDFFMVLDKAVTLNGLRFEAGDVFNCWLGSDWYTPCGNPSMVFDASTVGLGKNKIDALSVGPKEYYPEAYP